MVVTNVLLLGLILVVLMLTVTILKVGKDVTLLGLQQSSSLLMFLAVVDAFLKTAGNDSDVGGKQ